MRQDGSVETRLWRDEIRATVALAWPLILTNLTQSLIQATDVLLLGRAGPHVLAAGTLGLNLYLPFFIFGLGLVMASSPMMARVLGERRHAVRDVRRTVRQAMWSAVMMVVPVWILLWNTRPILLAFDQDPVLAEGAQQIVRGLQWGMLPALLYLVLRSFVAALEKPLWSLVVGAGGVLFNAGLNYALIFGKFGFPEMGLRGAGIGSTCANTFLFLGMAAVVSLHPRFRRYRLFGRFWHSDWPRFKALWRLGLPIAITILLEVAIFNGAVFMMGLIGADAVAAHAVAIQVATFTFMVPLGLSQAATVRVGLALGRRDKDGIGRAGWSALGIGLAFMTAMAIVMLAFPHQIVSAFLDPADPSSVRVASLAVSFLFVAALFQVFDGAQSIGAGMLRGLHDTKIPMAFAAFGYWVVGAAAGVWLAFGAGWEGTGIWCGLAIGLALVAVLMIGRWLGRERLGLAG